MARADVAQETTQTQAQPQQTKSRKNRHHYQYQLAIFFSSLRMPQSAKRFLHQAIKLNQARFPLEKFDIRELLGWDDKEINQYFFKFYSFQAKLDELLAGNVKPCKLFIDASLLLSLYADYIEDRLASDQKLEQIDTYLNYLETYGEPADYRRCLKFLNHYYDKKKHNPGEMVRKAYPEFTEGADGRLAYFQIYYGFAETSLAKDITDLPADKPLFESLLKKVIAGEIRISSLEVLLKLFQVAEGSPPEKALIYILMNYRSVLTSINGTSDSDLFNSVPLHKRLEFIRGIFLDRPFLPKLQIHFFQGLLNLLQHDDTMTQAGFVEFTADYFRDNKVVTDQQCVETTLTETRKLYLYNTLFQELDNHNDDEMSELLSQSVPGSGEDSGNPDPIDSEQMRVLSKMSPDEQMANEKVGDHHPLETLITHNFEVVDKEANPSDLETRVKKINDAQLEKCKKRDAALQKEHAETPPFNPETFAQTSQEMLDQFNRSLKASQTSDKNPVDPVQFQLLSQIIGAQQLHPWLQWQLICTLVKVLPLTPPGRLKVITTACKQHPEKLLYILTKPPQNKKRPIVDNNVMRLYQNPKFIAALTTDKDFFIAFKNLLRTLLFSTTRFVEALGSTENIVKLYPGPIAMVMEHLASLEKNLWHLSPSIRLAQLQHFSKHIAQIDYVPVLLPEMSRLQSLSNTQRKAWESAQGFPADFKLPSQPVIARPPAETPNTKMTRIPNSYYHLAHLSRTAEQRPTREDAIDAAKRLMEDYISPYVGRYASCGLGFLLPCLSRAATFHWKRHHMDVAQHVLDNLNDKTLAPAFIRYPQQLVQMLAGMLPEASINKVHAGEYSSLFHRIAFVCDQLLGKKALFDEIIQERLNPEPFRGTVTVDPIGDIPMHAMSV